MKRIWKFPLKITDFQEIRMPLGARILCVQTQFSEPMIWAEVDVDEKAHALETERRGIFVIGTGNPMPVAATKYIGTFQTFGGNLIWHVYEFA